MKKTTIVIALAAILGLALAAGPALAQNEQQTTEQSDVCPFRNQNGMTYEEMDRWMDTADHDRMHAAMGDMDLVMDGYETGPGNMMGDGNMMDFSG